MTKAWDLIRDLSCCISRENPWEELVLFCNSNSDQGAFPVWNFTIQNKFSTLKYFAYFSKTYMKFSDQVIWLNSFYTQYEGLFKH